nr:MAG TPA: hypothetical protein [Caudoviricetes sp.]
MRLRFSNSFALTGQMFVSFVLLSLTSGMLNKGPSPGPVSVLRKSAYRMPTVAV